jgi:hypothetical protein
MCTYWPRDEFFTAKPQITGIYMFFKVNFIPYVCALRDLPAIGLGAEIPVNTSNLPKSLLSILIFTFSGGSVRGF